MNLQQIDALLQKHQCHRVSAQIQNKGTGKQIVNRVVDLTATGEPADIKKLIAELDADGYAILATNDMRGIIAKRERMK